ncbi:hypothetical protein E4U32_005246 [Claviceps aff. humidiphila group G2b]|nr:hypothetical protein E4U32_005246 [Claviceps aff. humidiphila group G2b]
MLEIYDATPHKTPSFSRLDSAQQDMQLALDTATGAATGILNMNLDATHTLAVNRPTVNS